MKKNEKPSSARAQRFLGRCLSLFGAFVIAFAFVNQSFAQTTGTTGNSITFDSSNSTLLYSNLPASTDTQPSFSCYLRHNQAPIQIINANPTGYNNTVAPLQSVPGTGTGFFANSSLANNMRFANGDLEFLNLATPSTDWKKSPYKYIYFAVIAPVGYRFTEYYMDINGSAYGDGADGAKITRYTYQENSTYQIVETGESKTLTTAGSQIFNHALSATSNILYFKVEVSQANRQYCIHMNELRLTYVIDEVKTFSIPNSDEYKVHTGYIDLGTLQKVPNRSIYYFDKANVTDLEAVNIVPDDGSSTASIVNNKIEVPKAGTYWIEAPAKFRITGAKLNFSLPANTTEVKYTDVSFEDLRSGGNYLIQNKNSGYYLYLNGNSIGRTNIAAQATLWTITKNNNDEYTIKKADDNKYLVLNVESSSSLGFWDTDVRIEISSSPLTWNYNPNYGFYKTIRFRYGWSTDEDRTYYLGYSGNNWTPIRNTNATTDNTQLNFQKKEVVSHTNYTATVYGADGKKESSKATTVSAADPSQTITLSDFNNDGIKFEVTDKAAFTVDLSMFSLDPTLQDLEFDYLLSDNTEAQNRISAAATNFSFNAKEAIVLPIVPEVNGSGVDVTPITHQVVFRNAFNERRIAWYDGTATGLSNYYLVGSPYDVSGTENTAPDDKVNANQAGTNTIKFSNIESLSSRGGVLTENVYTTGTAGTNEWSRTTAGFGNIELTNDGEAKTVYIYSIDKPENCIMTAAGKNRNNHFACTFYDAKLQAKKVVETPVIAVTPLYTSTLKGANNKNSAIVRDTKADDGHTFYGVKVTAKKENGEAGDGYLSIAGIVDALNAEMEKQDGIYSGDVLRTILYVDMSELKSISGNDATWQNLMLSTADNCLFFMPSTFSNPKDNFIAGGEGGRAAGDIKVADQQPFYTPYNFTTGTHKAHYQRYGENGTPAQPNTTIILPFTVPTDGDGYAKVSSDKVNKDVQFLRFNGFDFKKGDYNNTYSSLTAKAITDGAEANKPYHVLVGDEAIKGNVSYLLEVLGASFVKTPVQENMQNKDDNVLTGHGSLNGVEIPIATTPDVNDFLYFSNNYFWKSSTLKKSKSVKILPYRVWYTYDDIAHDSGVKDVDRFGLPFIEYDNDEADAIELVNAEGQLLLGTSEGVLYVKTSADTDLRIYDMSGRQIVTDHLSSGNSTQYSLSKGVYIANGKKVLVK